ncbi:hypothetical protein CEP54_003732 [Fusarium duplospermum]|uniref:Rhodopsin domain-containing protein n=1 Tax=Fusarium duplospermum TaxID=1325734 RepID=A0A428QMS4_9HYPO|nr:hypothetical protein CEP54_003732 [Fusarium duplospermum]
MHLPWSKKLAVVGLFTSGIIVCIASVFILIQAIHYNPRTKEFPKEIALSMIWGGVEINAALFSEFSLSPHAPPDIPKIHSWNFNCRDQSPDQLTQRSTLTDAVKSQVAHVSGSWLRRP